jgi:uncharacterized protein YpuA (DUF1002 family)
MAITIGCCYYYCSRLLLYSYGPPVTFTTYDADWLIDCVTFEACANACCSCGIEPPSTPIKDIVDSSTTAAVASI